MSAIYDKYENMLDKIFKNLGLKSIHAEIYLFLVESGPNSAGNLSKKLGIPRSSLYGFLQELSQKEMVSQSQKSGIKIWQSTPPEKITDIINNQINRFEKIKDAYQNILPDMKNREKTDFIQPKFTYFEGRDGIRQMLKDVLLYRDISTEAFWPFKDMVDILGKEFLIENAIIKRAKQNIFARVIWPKEKSIDPKKNPFVGSGKEFKREIRIMSGGIDCSMGYWIYANKVMFISSKKESFGFILESKEAVQLMRAQFEILWKISKKMVVDEKYYKDFVKNNLK